MHTVAAIVKKSPLPSVMRIGRRSTSIPLPIRSIARRLMATESRTQLETFVPQDFDVPLTHSHGKLSVM